MLVEQSGMLVAHVILESAQGPNPSFFLFLGDFYLTWEPVFKNIFKIFVSIGFACFTGWL